MKKLTFILTKMTSVNAPYFTPDLRVKVLKMLGLKSDALKKGMVRVISCDKEESSGRRILLHYDLDSLEALQKKHSHTREEREEIAALASCRGIIIDLKTMKIIKRSFPQTVNIPTAFVPLNMNHPIQTTSGEIIPEWSVYRTFYGGTLVHSYWYEGKAYLASFKQIDVTKSRFGDSKTFLEIFFDDQDVVKNLDELYPPGCDKSEVHIFILNNQKLVFDTRMEVNNQVVYLRSLSLDDNSRLVEVPKIIKEKNASSLKPFIFGQDLKPIHVNQRLQGNKIDVSPDYEGDHSLLLSKYVKFFGGERVIYETNVGICTLVPPSCKYRQDITQGKNNINKLFVDCMADSNNSHGIVDIAFSYSDCERIVELMENHEKIYIDKFEEVTGDKQLKVLTNLIFSVPLCRLREVLEAYNKFTSMLYAAVDHIYSIFDDLSNSIVTNSLEDYPGIFSTKFRTYLCDNIFGLEEESLPIDNQWPVFIQNVYNTYYKSFCDENSSENDKKNLTLKMNITAIIGDATDDVMYSFFTFPQKYIKGIANIERKAALDN